MTDRTKGLIAILLAALFGSANSVVIKIGLREIPPLSYSFIRFAIAAIIILPFLLRGRKGLWGSLCKLAPVSLLATANIVIFAFGLKLTTATISQLLYAGVPLLTGLLLFLMFRERLNLGKIIGVVIGFLGVALVVLLPVLERGTPFAGTLTGNLIIGLAVVVFAFYMIYSKRAQKNASPFALTSAFIIVTAIVLLPISLLDLKTNPSWWQGVTTQGVFSVLYAAIISTVIVYLIQQYAIKHGGALVASLAFYLWPIGSYVVAAIVLGERLTPGLVAGGALALFGVYLVTRTSRAKAGGYPNIQK